jgi:tRNA A-37 threonylcarbamoyl transferase component Bud32
MEPSFGPGGDIWFMNVKELNSSENIVVEDCSAGGGRCARGDGLRWEFSEATVANDLKADRLDWTEPETFRQAELVKENALRRVWRVQVGGKEYYAKYYYRNGRRWKVKRFLRGPECIKEWRVARYAFEHGVDCVRPVSYAVARGGTGRLDCLLITESIRKAIPLNDYWESLRGFGVSEYQNRISELEDSLAELLAKAHQSGISHSDLHPGNLLVEVLESCRPRVCLVDLQSVRIGKDVSDREAIYNLAQLNQWFRLNATLTQRMRLLKRYMEYRCAMAGDEGSRWGQGTFKHWAKMMEDAAYQHAAKLMASRDRRTMRRTKYFEFLRLGHHWQGHFFLKTKHPLEYSPASGLEFRAKDWRKAFKDPQAVMERFAGESLPLKKSSGTLICRGMLTLGDKSVSVVIKRQVNKSFLGMIRNCFRKSRAIRAWKAGYAMIHRGMAVAKPLAVLERRIGPVVFETMLVTEEVKPSTNLRAFMMNTLGEIPVEKRGEFKSVITEQLATLMRKMDFNGFTHRDMKGVNILLQNMTFEYKGQPAKDIRVIVIDLDALKIDGRKTERDQLRAIVRLSYCVDYSEYVTRTDRARFLKAYLTQFGSGRPDWKKLWRKIAVERNQGK